MCGSPAVPSRKAIPNDSRPSLESNCSPGEANAVALRVLGRGPREQLERVEADLGQHEQGHDDAGDHQQAGLDDLHPRRGQHPAEDHVGEHEGAHDDHRRREADAGQGLDQDARADHLRDEVDRGHGQRADGRGHARGSLAQSEGEHVGERVLARVAHPLGQEQEHGQEGDDCGHQADEGVDAEQEDQAGEAQERGRRHVVAGDRPAVLEAGDRAPGGPELGGRGGPLGGPVRDAQGDGQHDGEDREGQDLEVGGEDGGHRALPSVGAAARPPAGAPSRVKRGSASAAARRSSGSNSVSALRR